MRKKVLIFLSTLLFFLFIFFGALHALASHQFPDVSENNTYHTAISYLVDLGAIKGYSDGTFGSARSVNRVESLKILFKAFGVTDEILGTPPATETGGFKDTLAGAWYIKYILRAKLTLVVQGYYDGTFRPSAQVKLGEALKMLFKVFRVDIPPLIAGVDLPNDVKSSDWFAPYVALAIEKNILDEDRFGNVKPGIGLSRQTFADLVYRMHYIFTNRLEVFPPQQEVTPPEGPVIDNPNISMQDFSFSPTNITIRKGTTVTFTNISSTPHQVATDPHPIHTQVAGFISNSLSQNQTYQFTFPNIGVFTYHCHLHPTMKGTIIVVE